MNPFFVTDFSISDSLKTVRKSVLIYETIITPYDTALETLGEDVLKAFQLKPISPDEVNLTPKLIRFKK